MIGTTLGRYRIVEQIGAGGIRFHAGSDSL
jgi:hypothetical protein